MELWIEDLIEDLQRISNVEALKEKVETRLKAEGFDIFALIGFSPNAGLQALNNHPKEWLERYRDAGHLDVDPTVTKALGRVQPLNWSEATHDMSARQRKVMAEGSDFGIVSGATLPVHGAGAERSLLFVSSNRAQSEFDAVWAKRRLGLQLLSIHLHTAFFSLVQEKDNLRVDLTDRERECLLWSARGKTAWEISVILNVSEATVNFHIANACRKLGCGNKIHAVVKAVMDELILP